MFPSRDQVVVSRPARAQLRSVRASLLEQVEDISVVGERVLLIGRPALFAGPQVTDVNDGVQQAALAVPAADRQRRRTQRRPGVLGDDFEGVTETAGTQHRLGHLQHRTQCPHIIDHRGVKKREARGVLATGDDLLSASWQLLFAWPVGWLMWLKTHETSRVSSHRPRPADQY